MNDNIVFFETYKEQFLEYISHIEIDLLKNNLKYKNIKNNNSEILKEYPKLRDILEENIAVKLDDIHCKALINYLDNQLELKFIELEEAFFRGYAEAYYFFTRCGLLKDLKKN